MPCNHKKSVLNRLPQSRRSFILQPTVSRQPNLGFTLIEIIVTLVLLGILAAVAGFGIVEVTRGYATARENERMAQTARIALLRISREVMELESVDSATAAEIAVTKPDGTRVAIGLSGTQILLDNDGDAGGGEILIDHVDSFQLSYTDFDDGRLARIDVRLSLGLDYLENPIPPFETSINPRNNGTPNAPY
jgi:prepilin-type N-terminal cleavage/methylation domain-containing protein